MNIQFIFCNSSRKDILLHSIHSILLYNKIHKIIIDTLIEVILLRIFMNCYLKIECKNYA